MDLEQAYEQGRIAGFTEPAGDTPDFETPTACGEWLTERLLDALRDAGLEGDVRTQVLVDAMHEEGRELEGGVVEVPLRGVVTVEQDCHGRDGGEAEHEGILVPFAVAGRCWLRDGKLVLQAASLVTEDEDVAYLD